LDAGVDAFVSKGDTPERLLEAVEECIKDRLREAEQYRLIRAAKGPRKTWGWWTPVALIGGTLLSFVVIQLS
jgi:hypothetical protein